MSNHMEGKRSSLLSNSSVIFLLPTFISTSRRIRLFHETFRTISGVNVACWDTKVPLKASL